MTYTRGRKYGVTTRWKASSASCCVDMDVGALIL